MAKKLINLLIEPESESKTIRRLRKITPAFSVAILLIFVIFHIISLSVVRANLKEYEEVKSELSIIENKVAFAQSSEVIYVTTIGVLEKIKNILSKDSNIIPNTLPILFNFQGSDVSIDSISVDNLGPVSFIVKTASIDVMNSLV